MYEFLFLFLMFMIYSIIGWIMETVGMSVYNKHFTLRGFLIGPYCPVYGIGAVTMILFLRRYLDDPITLFFMAIILTSFVEYMTSLLMEKIFNARWWDYSNRKFNINGRICLINSIGFGILGLLLLYVIEPFTFELLHKIPQNILMIVSSLLLIIFVIDVIISFNLVFKIKNNTRFINKDNTEEITKKVRVALSKHTPLTKRILKAFPKIKWLDTNISIANFKQALEKLELENKQKKLKWKTKKTAKKNKQKKQELKKQAKDLKRKKL